MCKSAYIYQLCPKRTCMSYHCYKHLIDLNILLYDIDVRGIGFKVLAVDCRLGDYMGPSIKLIFIVQ